MSGHLCNIHIGHIGTFSFIYQKLLQFFPDGSNFLSNLADISPIISVAVILLFCAVASVKKVDSPFIIYTALLYLFSPFILIFYAPGLFARGGGRGKGAISGFTERLGYVDKCSDNPVWIHAASVGEVGAAARVIAEIRKKYPNLPVVLSVSTPAGKEAAKKNLKDIKIFFFPFDFPLVVKRARRRIGPRLVVILEAEIWPNFLRGMSGHTPVALINARMSERTYRRFRMIRGFSVRVIGLFSLISAQSDTYKKRYADLGYDPEKIKISGNIKYDIEPGPGILQEDLRNFILPISKGGKKIMIAGSTHRGEEDEVTSAFLRLQRSLGKLFLILAPRHLNRTEEVESLLKKRDIKYLKRTELTKSDLKLEIDVLLLDTIGELSGLLNFGDVIFIGGSLIKGVGGHNVLEAAAIKKFVLFGPNMGNFPDISRELIDSGGGFVVRNSKEIEEISASLLTDEKMSKIAGERAFEVVRRNRGAIGRCIDSISPLIEGAK